MLIVRHKFSVSALYREATEPLADFLTKRWSFWLALFSCISFLIGNMVGQHGFAAFWKSVWGREQIAYEGVQMPLRVPDPDRWAGRGLYAFNDIPKDFFTDVPLPDRPPRCDRSLERDRRIISIDYGGGYANGNAYCGSHFALDILTDVGTPVGAAMAGIVSRIEERSWGFGNTVVLEHLDVPDPDDAAKRTTLYSVYAHLSKILVRQGEIVRRGQQIAESGQTGFATAPHLHFGLERADAPFHPYWPFTNAQATAAGLSFTAAVEAGLGQAEGLRYTVDPIAYIRKHGGDAAGPVIADASGGAPAEGRREEAPPPKPLTFLERLVLAVSARREQRVARGSRVAPSVTVAIAEPPPASPASSPEEPAPTAVSEDAPVPSSPQELPKEILVSVVEQPSAPVASITMLHDGTFEQRRVEQLVFFAQDVNGNFLQRVHFEGIFYLEATFGDAEFSPASLTAANFDDRGRAFVTLLPRGRKTIIPSVRGAFTADGQPMVHATVETVRTSLRGE